MRYGAIFFGPKLFVPFVLNSPEFSGSRYTPVQRAISHYPWLSSLTIVSYVTERPLPNSKYVPSDLSLVPTCTVYSPSVMDETALRSGLNKYFRTKQVLLDSVTESLYTILVALFTPHLIGSETWPYDSAVSLLTLDKSPSFPFYYTCTTKEQALEAYPCEQIVKSEIKKQDQETIFSTTLKSEMRLENKPARLFCPGPLHSTIVGNMLYTEQNDALAFSRQSHPIQLGITMPGHELNSLFLRVPKHFSKFHLDVGGFDTHFPPSVAAAICRFRSTLLPPSKFGANKAFYEKTYCGLIASLGRIFYMFGQRSGQTNTFTDNSFYTVSAIYHAFLQLTGLSLYQIDDYFTLINGSDDAFFGVHPSYCDSFNLVTLSNYVYKVFGMRLESPDIAPVSFLDLHFFSQHLVPVSLPHLGFSDPLLLAIGNVEKIESGFNWINGSNRSDVDVLSRFVALLLLLFADQKKFLYWRSAINRWARSRPNVDPVWRKLLLLANDDVFALRLHTGLSYPLGFRLVALDDDFSLD
jgi:hypothetical protein